MRRSKRRKTSVKSYSETEMANKFDIRDDNKASTITKIGYKKGPTCDVYEKRESIPLRCKKTGVLLFKDHPEFRPNLTPKEVLQAGSFGGTYLYVYFSLTHSLTHSHTILTRSSVVVPFTHLSRVNLTRTCIRSFQKIGSRD